MKKSHFIIALLALLPISLGVISYLGPTASYNLQSPKIDIEWAEGYRSPRTLDARLKKYGDKAVPHIINAIKYKSYATRAYHFLPSTLDDITGDGVKVLINELDTDPNLEAKRQILFAIVHRLRTPIDKRYIIEMINNRKNKKLEYHKLDYMIWQEFQLDETPPPLYLDNQQFNPEAINWLNKKDKI